MTPFAIGSYRALFYGQAGSQEIPVGEARLVGFSTFENISSQENRRRW